MKIVCEHCSARYTIADEKVRGRVFKLRCKKCGEAIIIRGDRTDEAALSTSAGDSEEGGTPAPVAGDGGWHLVIRREQVGPLDVEEVRARFADGEITLDTFGWREGFGEWLRLRDIKDFADLGRQSHPAVGEDDDETSAGEPPIEATRRTSDDVFARHEEAEQTDSGPSELFGSAPPKRNERAAAAGRGAARSSEKGARGGAEKVAARGRDESGERGRVFHEADTNVASAGAAARAISADAGADAGVSVESAKLTGQRRDNSVLFSLNNLQALGSEMSNGPSASSSSAARPGHASSQTGGSGLIDIRQMAAMTLQNNSAKVAARGGDSDPVPMFAPSVATPILMPQAGGMPRWVWAIIAGAGALVLGMIGIVVLVFTRHPAPGPAAPSAPVAVVASNTAAAAPSGATGDRAAPPASAPAADKAAPTGEAGKGTAPAAVAATGKAGKGGGARGGHGGKAPAGRSAPAAKAEPAHVEAAPPPAPKKHAGKTDDLDDLLNAAVGGKHGGSAPVAAHPAPAPPPAKKGPADDPSLPETLGRADVMNGMQAVQPRALACFQQFHVAGTAMVKVMIGNNGRISSAEVQGPLAGTPTGGCVARAVKGASFRKFRGSPFGITYPFILR